ncbi:reverse transcriptase [Apostichopus japonicus]|uniref:Reverse transcriptase n=1 Tax=Stichopus japonicus TaxID=307972 RepID=A0A2G8KWE2_STIJA|nr:reverse transcriptase [Apostichopus japonicus]
MHTASSEITMVKITVDYSESIRAECVELGCRISLVGGRLKITDFKITPRRLAHHGEVAPRGAFQPKPHNRTPRTARLAHQQGKVATHPHPKYSVSGCDFRFSHWLGETVRRAGHQHPTDRPPPTQQAVLSGQTLDESPRPHGQPGGCGAILPPQNASSPITLTPTLRPGAGRTRHASTPGRVRHGPPFLVAHKGELGPWTPLLGTQTSDLYLLRRFLAGLGSMSGRPNNLGGVGTDLASGPHQRTRDGGTVQSPPSLRVSPSRPYRHSLLRQHNGSGLRQQTGGDEVPTTVCRDMGPPALVPRQRHLSKSLAHCREGEPNSGRPVQGGPDPNGVVLTGNHLPEHVPPVRNSEHRLVRFSDQRQAPSLLHADLPPQSMGAFSISWEGMEAYAFPPLCLIQKVLLKLNLARTRLLLFAPYWPRRPWFPILLDLLAGIPRSLPDSPHLVSLGRARVSLPHLWSLNLTAWPLSGLDSERAPFLQTLPPWQHRPDGQAPSTLTIPNWHDSSNGVPIYRSVQILPLRHN